MNKTLSLPSLTQRTASLMAILYSLVISRSSLSDYENLLALEYVTSLVENTEEALDVLTITSPYSASLHAKEVTLIRHGLSAARSAIQYLQPGVKEKSTSEHSLRNPPNMSPATLQRNSPLPRRSMGEPRNLRECPYAPGSG